jgi:hypothetical protein
VHQVDEGGLVTKWGVDLVAPTAFENKTGISAVDANFFDVGIGEMLGQGTERCHTREHASTKLVRLVLAHHSQGAPLLFGDDSTRARTCDSTTERSDAINAMRAPPA